VRNKSDSNETNTNVRNCAVSHLSNRERHSWWRSPRASVYQ